MFQEKMREEAGAREMGEGKVDFFQKWDLCGQHRYVGWYGKQGFLVLFLRGTI